VEDDSATNQWNMTRHFNKLGMSQQETETWVSARQADLPFQFDWSDGVGHHLDKIWRRSIQRKILNRLPKRRTIIAILCAYSFALWMYVIIMEMTFPESYNWPLALWLPWLKMSYLGGMALLGSLVFGVTWFALRTDNTNRPKGTFTQ